MSKKPKRRRLSDLEALEVSFVPRGANKRKILLTKSEEECMDEILKELLEAELKDEGAIDAKIVELLPEEVRKNEEEVLKTQSTVKAALKTLQGLAKRLPEGQRDKIMGQLENLAGIKKEEEPQKTPEEIAKEEEAAKIAKEKEEKEKVAKQKEEANMDPKVQEELEAIKKAHDEKLELIQKENDDLKAEIKKERDMRILKEFEDKAKTEFSTLGKHGDVAQILKSAQESLDEEQYKKLEEVLKGADTKIQAGNIFAETGSSAGVSNDLDSKIEVAKEAIRKENGKLSEAQIESRVWEQNPELYTEYLKENPKQGGY